jgi:SAM-dependent methyltransferase
MSSWSAGYVLDIPYTTGFYRELAPSYLQFALASQGARPPRFEPGATYCELACGQGFGTSLLAAANPQARFWGFDFNPAQIANARRLAEDAGLKNIVFEDWSFEQALHAPADALPQFDMIVLHGIYSWISEENRRFIRRFIDHRLRPGGLVYVSYNCMPGWATMAPLQRLLREHADRHPDRSDLQAEAALKFAEAIKEGGAFYFAQNPGVAGRMEKLPGQNRNYLAHEYLNRHWHPLYHLDVVRELDEARLTYAGTATLTEAMDTISLPAGLHEMVRNSRDRAWQETLRDFGCSRQFRRDLFCRGSAPIGQAEQAEQLRGLRFAALVPRSAMTFKFQGLLGEVTGQEEIYAPIADALVQRPHTLGELATLPVLAGRPMGALLQALSILVHQGHVHPAPHEVKGKAADTGRAFNRVVTGRLRYGEQFGYLVAPAIGSGIGASYPELIAALALFENPKATAPQVAEFGWSLMAQTGQRLVKEGKTIQTKEETMPELEAQLVLFFTEKLPIWKQLGVI